MIFNIYDYNQQKLFMQRYLLDKRDSIVLQITWFYIIIYLVPV